MMLSRRLLLPLLLTVLANPARADEAAWDELRSSAIIVFRHANAPGVGDPDGFILGNCATQRNLDDRGWEQARGIGEAFRARKIEVATVLTSQWCRARETAELAFPGKVRDEPAFNSFFGNRTSEPQQTESARKILLDWKGPGALVVVTHQVNISALVGVAPQSGEGIVLRRSGDNLLVVGRIKP